MNVSFPTQNFINYILNPVSKLSENLLLKFEKQEFENYVAKTFVTSSDNSVILLSQIECKSDSTKDCIIPDCKTFLRLFSGVESNQVTLKIDNNVIKYKDSNNFSFKYHLLDESYLVNKKSLSESKINALAFDCSFNITKQKFSEIIKFNSIIPDAEKLYFFTQEEQVYCKIGDEQKSSTNEITTLISSSYEGESLSQPIPLDIKNILLFAFSGDNITIQVNNKLKIFKFICGAVNYIVSGLVK